MTGGRRGQSNLVALAVALLFVTAAVGVATAVSTSAIPDRSEAVDRRVATELADAFIAGDSPLTAERNVVAAEAVATIDGSTIGSLVTLPPTAGVRVQLGSETVFARGNITDGATVRRIVATTSESWTRRTPELDANSSFTVANRSRVRIGATANTTLETVRVEDRIVATAPDGLSTPLTVSVPVGGTVRVNVTGVDALATGDVWVETPDPTFHPQVLVVTVDA